MYYLSSQRATLIFGVAYSSSSLNIDLSSRSTKFRSCTSHKTLKVKSLFESTAEQRTASINGNLTSERRNNVCENFTVQKSKQNNFARETFLSYWVSEKFTTNTYRPTKRLF
ncbi:hypothetical protein L798_09638 [Zootermopsis nevadensis]|uniref:Uncharacterized protein n=1 Tax=Zootermopsis nevadensis TaxID=136037 RepID=A0A067R0G2_ZOONE|nr:hypothetical protein L798_09638 [Zootermopsis nevadensis]